MLARIRDAWSRITAHFVADWRASLKWGSVQLHAIATIVGVTGLDYVRDNPTALRDLAAQLPPKFPFVAVLVTAGGLWLVAGWVIRVWQGRPSA